MIGIDGIDGSGTSGPAALNDELARALRRAIATGNVRSDRDAQRFIERFMKAYNDRPQDELGGLSPTQANTLLNGEWKLGEGEGTDAHGGGAPHGLILATDLALDDLSRSAYLRRARALLLRLDESGGVKATQAGNLPRALVGSLLELEDASYVEDVKRYNKVINEADHERLHFTRLVLGLAGLTARRKGRFVVTRNGRALAPEPEAGPLFALLFQSHFQEFNLAYVDGCPEAPGFQRTIAYALWRFGHPGGGWRTPDEWAPLLLLPPVRAEILGESRWGDSSPTLIKRRLLDFLVQFGLAESRPRESAGEGDGFDGLRPLPEREYISTEVFDRFLSFGV